MYVNVYIYTYIEILFPGINWFQVSPHSSLQKKSKYFTFTSKIEIAYNCITLLIFLSDTDWMSPNLQARHDFGGKFCCTSQANMLHLKDWEDVLFGSWRLSGSEKGIIMKYQNYQINQWEELDLE